MLFCINLQCALHFLNANLIVGPILQNRPIRSLYLLNLCSDWWFIENKTILERDMTCSHDIGTDEKLSFILFKKFTKTIFVINDATSTARSASYLDLHLETDSEGLIRKQSQKR